MASSFLLTLKTAAPAAGVNIDAGATWTIDLDVALAITSDADTTGYSMKIYGDVDDAFAPTEYRTLEANAPWISFAAAKTVKVTGGDALKTVRVKVRDAVGNISGEATDAITLDTTAPVPNVTAGPAPAVISKQVGFRTSAFTVVPNSDIVAWEARVVVNATDARGAGTLIPQTNGSVTQGGAVASGANINGSIDGRDLETASPGDAQKRVKIFMQDAAGNWSVAS